MDEQALTGGCVLVATDLSVRAECTAHWGRQIARAIGCSVVVAHVVALGEGGREEDGGGGQHDERAVEQRYRYRLRDWYRRRVGEEPAGVWVGVGSPAEALVRAAEEREAAMIVVCSSDKNALDRLALGSTTHRLLRSPPRTLAVVHPDRHDLREEGAAVVGTDLTPDSDPAVAAAGELAGALDWPLHLVHASRLDSRYLADEYLPDPIRRWATARRRGRAMRETLRRTRASLEDCPVYPRIVDDLPVRGLCRHIERVDADLVVLGHHPDRSYARSVLTSVAVRCVRAVRATFLVVPVGE